MVVIVVICCVVYRVRSGVSAMVLATKAAKVTATRGRKYCPPVTPPLRRSPSDSDQDAAVHVPSREGTGTVYEALIP